MNGILDRIAEAKSARAYTNRIDEAERLFATQQSAILAIAHEEGFAEIRKYWLRVYEATIQRLSTCKGREFEDVQAEMKVAKRFLDFLDNITSPQELPE